MKRFPYLRIYFDRGTAMTVLDSGPGTETIVAKNVSMAGIFRSEHATIPDVRPRYWLVARNAEVVHTDTERVFVNAG
jgi:hypothetical protein